MRKLAIGESVMKSGIKETFGSSEIEFLKIATISQDSVYMIIKPGPMLKAFQGKMLSKIE